ncbi:hypothetical protein O1611_g7367 [Lasiodiplodia mahajangana]|uniref:Uncharacterized protein n=1 Tax=Lasiodiplodia mahajangana TaxID=1108764 RepID=A0ACC2JFV2_9PEZI|nr:hypothetical protein O1611_g7367 [Lasiodiplodia mahajangana]
MADQDMRLRLVVRRNGLPELRLMWHVQLSSNPTISKLLEQLNDHVPLEGEHWGLEDYAVELHDNDGTDFECLHYQLVRSVLKPDDRVFIRALDRDDHRRRRISGRLQISSDGRHLIDGVPFGRPHLRASTGRPATHIPPRKRLKFTDTQSDDEDSNERLESERRSQVRYITDGLMDRDSNSSTSDYIDSASDGDELNSLSNESRAEDDSNEESDQDVGEEEDDDQDLGQEARDLAAENAMIDEPRENMIILDAPDKLVALHTAFPTAGIDMCKKVLAALDFDLKTAHTVLSEGFSPEMSQEALLTWTPSSINTNTNPEQSQALVLSASTDGTASERPTKKRKLRDQSPAEDPDSDVDEGDNASLIRKYDHAGFPPGTITSGTGLSHMAAISASFDTSKINGNSEATSTTLKARTEEPLETDDDTSSSGSSSDSDASSDGSDDTSDEDSSSSDSSSLPSSDSASVSDSDSSSLSSSDSSDNSDSGSDDDLDDGADPQPGTHDDVPSSPSNGSGSDSDSGPEEYPFKTISHNGPTATDKDAGESSGSSDDSSDSSESEDTDDESHNTDAPTSHAITTAQTLPQTRSSAKSTQENNAIPVPPGAGKESTRRRNARRRAAKLAKRETHATDGHTNNASTAGGISTEGETTTDEAALFKAKREALLQALETGGIEIRPSGESSLDHSFIEADTMKRKRTEENNTILQPDENEAAVETVTNLQNDEQEGSPASQKRRRIDLGTSRRFVFNALGLRNPKTKEDEDQLRNKLQANVPLRGSQQRSSQSEPSVDKATNADNDQDPNAWKLKINYRAVECCHDGVELSPAPFPFQQRWDPQQQNFSTSKKNRRGGHSKRAQRNQAQYYDDDSRPGKKRKRHDPYNAIDNGYDDMYDREEVTSQTDIRLNYDDIESQGCDRDNDTEHGISQATDFDDLPSLPKDVSVLPILRPGQAEAGMVITWQKWSCSSATNWQPQLSRVTAIVVTVDENAVILKVCLAKRDRHLDGNEKRYDHRTGQRIYDKFEAPDLGEDGDTDDPDDTGVDEGYRDVPWAEMQDPRILQQPLDTTVEFDSNSKCIDSVEIDGTTTGIESQPKPSAPPVPSQQKSDAIASPSSPIGLEPAQPTSEENSIDIIPRSDQSPELGDSWVESSSKVASNSISYQAEESQQTTNSAMSDISQISSPSRQLHETTSQAIGSNSPVYNWTRTTSVGRTESPPPRSTTPSSVPLPATISSQVIVGTPVVLRPIIPPSSSSLHSGRQPDYTMDVEGHQLDPFDATDEIDHESHDNRHKSSSSVHSSPTPRPARRTATPDQPNKMHKNKITSPSPIISPTSRSLPSSPSSVWCTAVTSLSTQSPWRTQPSSVISKPSASRLARDAKYEEAMRRLDEEFDNLSDAESPLPATNSLATNSLATDSLDVKRESSSQFPLPPRALDAISPPPRRRSSKPFTIPPGTQVVELSSDSEPIYEENYADDEIDETYSPEQNSMPRGDGWVKKRQRTTRRSIV